MKRIFVFALAFAAFAFAGCSDKSKSDKGVDGSVTNSVSAENPDTDNDVTGALNTMLNAKDSKGFDSLMDVTRKKIDELVKSGQTEKAKEYASKVKTFLDENAQTVKSVIGNNEHVSSLLEKVSELSSETSSTVSETGKSVKESVENATATAKQKAADKVEDAKSEAKEKVRESVEKQKEKADEAVNKAADKALKGLGL